MKTMTDDYPTEELIGYFKYPSDESTDPMECDHDYITLMLPVPTPHDYPMETGCFCSNCNARLDGVHGIIHYNKQFKYQDRKKAK